jgi:hypothetical protein
MASHQEVYQQVWSNNLTNIQCWCILNGEFVQNNVNNQMVHTEVCKEISNLYGGINDTILIEFSSTTSSSWGYNIRSKCLAS